MTISNSSFRYFADIVYSTGNHVRELEKLKDIIVDRDYSQLIPFAGPLSLWVSSEETVMVLDVTILNIPERCKEVVLEYVKILRDDIHLTLLGEIHATVEDWLSLATSIGIELVTINDRTFLHQKITKPYSAYNRAELILILLYTALLGVRIMFDLCSDEWHKVFTQGNEND